MSPNIFLKILFSFGKLSIERFPAPGNDLRKHKRDRTRSAASSGGRGFGQANGHHFRLVGNCADDNDGEFALPTVPIGDYKITVSQSKFESSEQTVTVDARSSPVLHFQLAIATLSQTATVNSENNVVNTDSVTPTTLVARGDIAQTPGADRTNSMAMITDYTPGAYVTHDMLHMRGGHQVDWLIDGVPVPNTNIATNLGPQIDPKDIDYLEVQRGSYDAEYGDRTYGIFNIVPRSGFERDNEAELVTSFGNWYQTNDQFNLGGHTERFAYYASVNANRSNYGLQPPIGKWYTMPITASEDSHL